MFYFVWWLFGITGAWIIYYLFKLDDWCDCKKYQYNYSEREHTWCPTPLVILATSTAGGIMGPFALMMAAFFSLIIFVSNFNIIFPRVIPVSLRDWFVTPLCKGKK